MVFRGYFSLAGQEFANSSRALAHIAPTVPTRDDQVVTPMVCSCDVRLPYDDTWPGLAADLGDDPYVLEDAPWFDAARPESTEFAGVWVLDVQGFDAVPVSREVVESICAGGTASRARDTSRTVTFSALLFACSNAGAEYGKNWLACVLRAGDVRGGAMLALYGAHPSGTAAAPEDLRRYAFGAVLTKAPVVTDFIGKGGSARHRQASGYRVEWEMVLTRPYLYGQNRVLAVDWDTEVEESITWAHAPDCEGDSACELPTIYNADCVQPEIPLSITDIPTCGGCLPLCSIMRRTWELPASGASTCDTTAASLRITNDGETPLTVNFFWRPCGSTDRCDRSGLLQVSGLPAGMTVVVDSVTGRPYIENDGVQQRQVGIVSTPSGAPWTSTLLDTVMCQELVAESVPGAEYSVLVELRDRDA